ncbi:tetratricopeptide repeat protein [Pseudomonas sp. sp1636]|uniref:tetratricopeptide repeat protein n=1 Tax=Pseudomonas sp. sp1636 TaxID=3036707 RepID=UPI0025A55689|nr:tetratricopeptide repeat protein [Pseudomonas sp. sp1636]MDM8347451.1 tetratricopeptide repeat protein [Pseudomonas sp. sp1636]
MVSRTDEEELAVIRDWWQRNGKPLLTGSALALVLVFGWQGWQKYQAGQAHGASMAYQQLLESALNPSGQPDPAKVAELANALKRDFAGSHYAQYGSLFVAKVAVESGKLDDAAAELQAIVDQPVDDTLAELARQRLARVLAAQDKTEEALKLLEGDADQAYLASREELKGDLLVKLGRSDEAYAAYVKAKAALAEEAAVGGLQMKLDDLAKGDA